MNIKNEIRKAIGNNVEVLPIFHTTKTENFKEIANIKWVFSKTESNGKLSYESGLPHTRKNIIFLSDKVLINDEDELIKVLIHEKIHIYQRNNSDLFKSIIILAFNPTISPYHFLRSMDDAQVFNTTYLDNPYLPEQMVKEIEALEIKIGKFPFASLRRFIFKFFSFAFVSEIIVE